MQRMTDLYLCSPVRSARLRFVELFDARFLFDAERIYSGYLGVNIERIKMVSIVSDLRKHNIECFSVPIKYRDEENISLSSALVFAKKFAREISASALDTPYFQLKCSPLHWFFGLDYEDAVAEKAGGVVMIDRIDGHVWSAQDYAEYMYDYNNVL